MKYTHLPSEETPKQLTAYRASQNLEEHFLAFLNYNNQQGFEYVNDSTLTGYTKFERPAENQLFSIAEVQNINPETIAGLLIMLVTKDEVSIAELSNFAYQIAKITKGSGNRIKQVRARDMIARLLGYVSHEKMIHIVRSRYRVGFEQGVQDLSRDVRKTMVVINRRDRSMIDLKVLGQLTPPSSKKE